MPTGRLESFYLDELGRKEPSEVKPHPPAPLFPLALGLLLGIACDAVWALGPMISIVGLGTAAIGVWACNPVKSIALFKVLRGGLIVICGAASGSMLHDAHFRHLPANHVARFVTDTPFVTTVIGEVVSVPRLVPPYRPVFQDDRNALPRTMFVISLEGAEGSDGVVNLTGLLKVIVAEPIFDIYPADRLRIFGKLYKPPPPDNPGEFDWALAQQRRGIHAGISCKFFETVQKSPRSGALWRRLLSKLRLQARTLLLDDVLEDELSKQSLVNAMILGQRSQVDRSINEAFRRTGTVHFLALSGMHIGLLAMFLWLAGRSVGLPRRWTAALIVILLCVYAVLVEPRPSVIRATIIAIVFCAGCIFRRPSNKLNSLSLAAIILMLWDPLQVFQAGFQLSFIVALGIFYLMPVFWRPLTVFLRPPSTDPAADSMSRSIGITKAKVQGKFSYFYSKVSARLIKYGLVTFCICLSAWLVGTPLAAYHFNSFFAFGWPFTALLAPLVLLMMVSGFFKLLLGLLWPSSSVVLGPILEWATQALVWSVELLAKTPNAMIHVPTPAVWWIALYYLFLSAVILWRRPIPAEVTDPGVIDPGIIDPGVTDPGGKRVGLLWPVLLGTACILTAIPPFLPRTSSSELRITLLSVGPGSATIIEAPDGRAYLYDAGTLANYDVGFHTVLPAMRALGIRHIDTAIISHPNYDHYSAFFSLFDAVDINQIVLSPHFERFCQPGEADTELLRAIRERGIEIGFLVAGQDNSTPAPINWASIETEILWPAQDLPLTTTANDSSLVIRLNYGGHSVLLTGDIEQYAQEQLLAWPIDLHADVLVLPHHGSVHRATSRFIDAVDPTYVLRSSGQRRSGEPSRIEEIVAGYSYLNTADVGAITITLGPQELSVESFFPPQSSDHTALVQAASRSSE